VKVGILDGGSKIGFFEGVNVGIAVGTVEGEVVGTEVGEVVIGKEEGEKLGGVHDGHILYTLPSEEPTYSLLF
jgi:hypothetical protein